MKSKSIIYQQLFIILGLLIALSVFIASGPVKAQDNTPAPPAVGLTPTELTLPFSTSNMEPDAPQPDTVSALTEMVYLPIIVKPSVCDLNAQEQEIEALVTQHPDQGRPFMTCDPILAQVARERALDMGTRNYFSHTNPDGYGPNYLVRQAGYALPTWYGTADDANNIESIAAGYTTASAAWNGWMNSSGHRAHLLAEYSFWAAQTSYGIGYAYVPNSTYRHYWVFISAPPEE